MTEEKILIFGDTETSGLDTFDKIAQLAYSYIYRPKSNYGQSFSIKPKRFTTETLCNPGVPINPEASASTGIFDIHVRDEKKLIETQAFKHLSDILKNDNVYFVAYNAPFDVDMLEKDGLFIPTRKIIDLYRVVKHLYKDFKTQNRNGDDVPLANNKMQYFRGFLRFDEQEDFNKLVNEYGLETIQAHTALSDVVVLEYFYHYIINEFNLSFEDLLELSNKPVFEPFITFGNVFEKGTPFKDCLTSTYEQYGRVKNGYDYIDWCSSNLTLAVDTLWSVNIHFFDALVNGDVSYNKKFNKYLDYGLVFERDAEKINKALTLLQKDIDYVDFLRDKFISNLEVEVEEKLDQELGDRFPSLFLLNYLNSLDTEIENRETMQDIVILEENPDISVSSSN